ncbi:MAG: GDYXXLXY domain-containing protein [Kiritimatiellia bacterium]
MRSERLKVNGAGARFWLVVATLAVQVLALGWLIARYERVVQCGTEVRFRCQAYDPYDPLRGRYLRMSVREVVDAVPPTLTNDVGKVYVRVEPATNGLWRVAEAARAPAASGIWLKPRGAGWEPRLSWREQKEGESWKDFHRRQTAAGRCLAVTFPDQLFVNEKLAPEAERLLRAKSADAVAVYRVLRNDIVLTGIEIGGRSIVDEARGTR